MDRAQKTAAVEWIGGVFDENEVIVVLKNGGLTVAEMSDLRTQLREGGAAMKVVKNRLAKIAIADKPGSKISDLFAGPTAIAYSADPVSAPKVLTKYAKDNEKLEILGGVMGETLLDAAGVKTLASMPSREEVLSSIVGMIGGPASSLVSAVTSPATNLAGILKTLAEREDA